MKELTGKKTLDRSQSKTMVRSLSTRSNSNHSGKLTPSFSFTDSKDCSTDSKDSNAKIMHQVQDYFKERSLNHAIQSFHEQFEKMTENGSHTEKQKLEAFTVSKFHISNQVNPEKNPAISNNIPTQAIHYLTHEELNPTSNGIRRSKMNIRSRLSPLLFYFNKKYLLPLGRRPRLQGVNRKES